MLVDDWLRERAKIGDYATRLPRPSQGEGRIWFYRPGRVPGAAVQPSVQLNGRTVGKAKPGGFFYADRPAGDYEVECTTESTHECRITLAPQSTKYIRFNLMPGLFVGHVVPVEVNSQTALVQL